MSPDWLAQLAPAHAPPAPGWWPPAPGWWAVVLLCLLLAAGLLWAWRAPRRARRRTALRELRRIRAADEADAAASARAIENVLRRYALAVFGHARVARLSGEAWLGFAGRNGGDQLAGETGRSLLAAAFGSTEDDRREQWLAAAEGFIRRARIQREPGRHGRAKLDKRERPRQRARAAGEATR